MHYSVGEVARKFRVTTKTIKNWERDRKIPPAKRVKRNNWRFWDEQGLARIRDFAEGTEEPGGRR